MGPRFTSPIDQSSVIRAAQDVWARYPELLGLTVTAGFIAQRTNRIEARLGFGAGAFIVDPTGLRGTRVGAMLSQADVTLFPVTHIGLIAGARWIAVPRYHGDRLSVFPWALGLRFR